MGLFDASRAVTVKLKDEPAVAVEGAETVKCVAGCTVTTMEFEVPVMELITVSVAVMVWVPPILRVAEKVPVPPVSVELDGKVASTSLLVKWTVPV